MPSPDNFTEETSSEKFATSADARNQTTLNQQDWLFGLRQKVDAWTAAHPVASMGAAPERDVAMAQVLGAGFAAFVMDEAPALIAGREQSEVAPTATPILVWITDAIGMMAAATMIEPDAPQLLAVPQPVFDRWMEQHPDWACNLHVEHIGLFSPLDAEDERLLSDAQRNLVGQWWVHRSGMIWGEDAGHEARHLWRWFDGAFSLVEQSLGGAVVY